MYGSIATFSVHAEIRFPIFTYASLAIGESYDCPTVGEETLQDTGKWTNTAPQQSAERVANSWDVLQGWL